VTFGQLVIIGAGGYLVIKGHMSLGTLVAFVGLLPSFISQVTFIHAVGLIGPARAGVFLNLVPIFGPLLAVLVLGEPLSAYHAVALVLVLGGIYIAETTGPRGR